VRHLTESCHNTGIFSGSLPEWPHERERRMNNERKTKQQLAEEVSRLGERLDLFQGLVENSPDAIAMTDAQGQFTYVNPGTEALTGYTAEEMLGMRAADLYPGGLEAARDLMQLLRAKEQLRNHQYSLKVKDGRIIEAFASFSLLHDAEGEVSGTMTVWKDVTEQRRAEEALRRSEERSDALYRVSNLLAGAHDTDEVLDLIVNEAARLVGAKAGFIRLWEGGIGVPTAATTSAADYLAEMKALNLAPTMEDKTGVGQVMATMKPLVLEDATTSDSTASHVRILCEKHGFYGMAIVPMMVNGQPIGLLAVFDGSVRRFTEDEVSLLAAFADQASLALEKARLLNEAEREKERAETERERSDALYRVSNLLASAHDTDEVLDLIVNEASRLVGASAGQLRLLEGGVLVPRAATESAAAFLAEDPASRPTVSVQDQATMMARVMATKKPITVDDATETELVPAEVRLLHQKHGLYGTAAVPLLANDRSLGVLFVYDKRIRSFTDDEVSLLMAFADQASLALEKARLLNEAEREKERSDALYQISNQLAGAHDTDELLDLIVNEAARLIRADQVNIRLLEGEILVHRAGTGSTPWGRVGENLPVGEGANLSGHVIATKKPLFGEEAAQYFLPKTRRIIEERGGDPAAIAAVPLLANDQAIGTLVVGDTTHQGRRFTDDEVSLISAFADQASLALEKARLLNEAETERERADSLYRISNQLAGAHDTDEVLDLIVNEAARLVGVPFAYIFLLEKDSLSSGAATEAGAQWFKGLDLSFEVEEGTSLAGHVMATKKPLFGDAAAKLIIPKNLRMIEAQGLDPAAAGMVPLLANDRSIGTLYVGDDVSGRRFTEDEISLLSAFADQASLALEKARLLSEAETRERQAIQLYEVTTQLASNHDLDSVLELITHQSAELMGGRAAGIFRYDESRGALVWSTMYNLIPEMRDMLVRPGEGNAGRAYQERRAVWTNDLMSEARYSDDASQSIVEAQFSDWGAVGVVSAPILIQDEVYGVLEVIFDKHREVHYRRDKPGPEPGRQRRRGHQ
jgi:PAS domain S-box-containing protein